MRGVGWRVRAVAPLCVAWWMFGCSVGTSVVGGADARVDVVVPNDLTPAKDVVDVPDAPDVPVDVPMDVPAGCRSNADCATDPGGAVCDTASGRCVRCVATADTCGASQHCDPMTFVCVDGCHSDEGCAGPATDGGVADAGDAAVASRVCDTTAHRCVQCRTDDNCPSGMLCMGQQCVMGCSASRACPMGQTCCGGGCVDLDTNTAACGACGRPCTITHGTPACAMGRCGVSTCEGTFGDCNADAADGCETDLTASATHCGMCGRACTFPHASGACMTGTCAITRCDDGFADCDTNPANGCETDTRTAVTACGACGAACSFANATATCAAGTCALGACNTGFANCDANPANGCETAITTTDNCGVCGRSCTFAHGAAACADGNCALGMCNAGFANCDGNAANGCEADLTTSTSTCGGCGTMCSFANASAICTAGACGLGECSAGFADCDMSAANGCEVNQRTDGSNCGACGRVCSFPNAAASCVAGTCAMGACAAGFADCDMSPSNGCEVNLATSTANCGRCGNACSFAGGTASCVASVCQLTMCATGRGDCDGDRGNGCETDLTSTVSSCSSCGAACVTAHATPACLSSTCAVAGCEAGFADCNARAGDGCEVSLRTDVTSCGMCGRACSLPNAVPACTAATCVVATCATGFGDCDLRDDTGCEVDVRTSTANCGTCGRACTFANAAASCAAGSCVLGACGAGFADCNTNPADGCEVDTRVNVSNCGSCGRACSFANAAAVCTGGTCALGACNAGFADCDGNAANGCETDTRASVDHCGACGRSCSTGRCAAGVCDRAGDGSDGVLTVSTTTTLTPAATPLVADVAVGGTSLRVISTAGFSVGNEVMVIDMRGGDAGHYEFGRVTAATSTTLTLAAGVAGAFTSSDAVQVVRVFRYSALTVSADQALRAPAWNGSTGGVLPIRVLGAASIVGTLDATGSGYRGGAGDSGGNMCGPGAQGESPSGEGGRSTAANGGGGGGGAGGVFCCGGCGQSPGGGGGGYGDAAAAGTGEGAVGSAGGAYGAATLTRLFLGAGGGGGGGNCGVASGPGGSGGAIVYLAADSLSVTGNVTSLGTQGGPGGGYEGAGGGGAGGSVFLAGRTVTVTASHVAAGGGASNVACAGTGGAGAVGRVRIECNTLNGAACPGASGAIAAPAASVGTF